MRCCSSHDGPEVISALAFVEGLDAGTGLSNVGGNTEAYTGMLMRFCADYANHETAILQYLSAMDWKAYSVKLHAMKGLFATVGADTISAKAYRLELASRNGDADTCQMETPEFCGAMRSLKESLCGISVLSPRKVGPRTVVKPAILAEKLVELRAACLEGDCDAADAVLACLWTLSLGEEDEAFPNDESLDGICSLADSLDYDKAVERIDVFLKALNGS